MAGYTFDQPRQRLRSRHVTNDDARRDHSVDKTALMWFGALSLVVTFYLLSQLGNQTDWVSGLPLSRQPALSSIVSLCGMALFGLCWLFLHWRRNRGWWRVFPFAELRAWLASIEYVAWFMCYVWLVPITGYLLTTIAFCLLLALRCGYRSRRAMLSAAGTALCIVVLFKSLLAVKIPAAAIYEWLPSGLRNFMIIYF